MGVPQWAIMGFLGAILQMAMETVRNLVFLVLVILKQAKYF